MNYNEVAVIADASINRACGATATYVEAQPRGTTYCPKCGKWVSNRSFVHELGWCHQCAFPGHCIFCNEEIYSNATTCTSCRNRYYKRMRYLMERNGLSQDDAVAQIRSEGGKSGQQVRRERELHQNSYIGYGHFQEMPTPMGLDESEQR